MGPYYKLYHSMTDDRHNTYYRAEKS